MEPIRLFLAHSFATEKMNSLGEWDKSGISDFEIADRVATWIQEFGEGLIEVVRTRDPLGHYITSAVREDICSADAVLCLFTKRTKDSLTGLWVPSVFVASEGSAALMQFPSEDDTHRRLFGLVEEGVDVKQLGMAFNPNKTVKKYRRDDLNQLREHVRQIVAEICDARSPSLLRDAREYLSIDKVVSILKDGSVTVETRHRFRFTEPLTTVEIPHILWRVSAELPEIKDIMDEPEDSPIGFLRAVPAFCGSEDGERLRCEIKPGRSTGWKYERNFKVVFADLRVKPGDELEYEVAWGYPNAFHRYDAEVPDQKPNSVGLRTSRRGRVQLASLTLKFQRFDAEPFHLLESPPLLYTTDITDIPGDSSTPEDFMHDPKNWRAPKELSPCRKRRGVKWEVYRWESGPFIGMAKATWTAHRNYFHSPDPTDERTRAGHNHDREAR